MKLWKFDHSEQPGLSEENYMCFYWEEEDYDDDILLSDMQS